MLKILNALPATIPMPFFILLSSPTALTAYSLLFLLFTAVLPDVLKTSANYVYPTIYQRGPSTGFGKDLSLMFTACVLFWSLTLTFWSQSESYFTPIIQLSILTWKLFLSPAVILLCSLLSHSGKGFLEPGFLPKASDNLSVPITYTLW